MKTYSLATVLILSSIIFISTASAINSLMYYPGSNCQPKYGTQAGDFVTGYKSIKNNSNKNRIVACPIPTNYGGWSAVDFNVRSPTGNTKAFNCFVTSSDRNGVTHSVGSSRPVSTGAALLSSIRTNNKSYTVYQNLYCVIPPKSEINWYRPGFAID